MLSTNTVHETLKEIVAEYGEDYDYPYEACRYGDPETGEPMCIVGHVLYRLEPEVFRRIVEDDWINCVPFRKLVSDGRVSADEVVRRALCAAQVTQDTRESWGEALKAFENEMEVEA